MAENKRLLILGKSGSGGGGTQVQSDWAETDDKSMSYIKNKPELSSVATSGNYDDLLNKPTIPSKTSELTNDSNFLTESNLKTINGESIVGEGNLEIQGGGTQVQSDWAETDDQSMSYIKNKPTLSVVATTGSYNDLTDKPTIPEPQVNSDWNSETGISQILNKPTLSIVATSGSYNDLLNKPNIPSKTSELTNDSNFLTESNLKTINGESIVGTGNIEIGGGSGTQVQSDWAETNTESVSYIKNKPTIPDAQVNSDWNASSGISQILNKPTLSIVATSGSYDDLLNKPTIPDAQVNSDWNSESGISQILNKPTLSIVATSGSYNDLLNKPTIPSPQVNSDWNSETGVSQILNKPEMTTQTLTFVDENNAETNVIVYIQPTV